MAGKARRVEARLGLARRGKARGNGGFRVAVLISDEDLKRRSRQQLADWNANNPESRIVIQPGQINRRVKELRRSREDRFIRSAPKEIRGQVRQELQDGK